MSTEHIGQTYSREAGEAMTDKQHYIVQLSAAGLVEVGEGATDLLVGVLQNTPAAGEQAVYAYTGVAKVKAGGTIGVGAWVTAAELGRAYRELICQLKVTEAATDVGDTLDVYIDTSFDGGDTYVNIGHFTQVLGNGGAKTFVMAFCNDNPGTSAVVDVSSNANAGATRQIGFGSKIRYRGVMADADADGSFTYEVKAFVK